jgi:membrane associated rhomboid family serine protease
VYLQYGTFFPSWEQIVEPGWSEQMAYRYTENLFGRVVGASGAVFGVLLAFGMLFPNTQLFLLFPPIPIKAKYFVLFYGLLELVLGLQAGLGSQIAHFAHLGGMLFGFLLLRSWQRDRGTFY